MNRIRTIARTILPWLAPLFAGAAWGATLTVDTTAPGKAISADLIGIFFEDLNHAADGGLYAELVQNRSFEFQATENPRWNALSFWTLDNAGGRGRLSVDDGEPLHPNNPHYAVLEVVEAGPVRLSNPGFKGIPVQAGETYRLSLYLRRLYAAGRWDAEKTVAPLPLSVRLESAGGDVLGEATFQIDDDGWRRQRAEIVATGTDAGARLVLQATVRGGFALDEVSLFPEKTFLGRENGLRADLAQAIADLKPAFMRFPGGCLVHGHSINNLYRWKETIGPVEQRRQQRNLWGYHQSMGLGFFEYFQFAEDIGAKPLPVVPAGVCCQNAGYQGGTGQRGLPLDAMPDYVQEVLDLIEYANGPADSEWGARRAAAGHPEPFGLEYIGVGNEDRITPLFRKRFEMIHKAVKARHPEITVIGTVGPFSEGEDYEQGWAIANALSLGMVDEHYYQPPDWFWNNLSRYDGYDRRRSQVYLGEYAAHEEGRRHTLRAALAEAAYLTSLERNGDIVRMSSYAPLLARREGYTNWAPDLIYFTGTELFRSISYHVQQLFRAHRGDRYLPTALQKDAADQRLAASAVRDSASGDLILKLVNGDAARRVLQIRLPGLRGSRPAELVVLGGVEAETISDEAQPDRVLPQSSTRPLGERFEYEAPPHSLTIIRVAGAT